MSFASTAVLCTRLRAAPAKLSKAADLDRWLASAHLDLPSGALCTELCNGSQSNPTVCVGSGDRRYVLRSKP